MRVYQAVSTQLIAAGHMPWGWYYRPESLSPFDGPLSPAYGSAAEAHAAAVEYRERVNRRDAVRRSMFDPSILQGEFY